MNRKTVYSLLATVALAASLAACGDDSGDDGSSSAGDFCDLLEEANDTLSSLDSDNPDDVSQGVSIFEDITAAAPDTVKDDWQTVTDGVRVVVEIGPSPDPEEHAEVLEDLSDLEPAKNRVEQHALDECDVELE